jgi:hypothetical protein
VADRKAADAYLATNPPMGSTVLLPSGNILRVAWHQNHEGQWGTASYKPTLGQHKGVQVEKLPPGTDPSQLPKFGGNETPNRAA